MTSFIWGAVVVINAEKVKLTGNKWEDKQYVRHTGYPGGQRITTAKDLLNKRLLQKHHLLTFYSLTHQAVKKFLSGQ